MNVQHVHVSGLIAAPPAYLWALVGDFGARWHPAIAGLRLETGPGGALVRAFTLHGEAGLYREQLAYRSDSDHALAYLALEGIAGADRYSGRIELRAEGSGTRLDWRAEITAPGPRAAQIAEGTRAIFEAGIKALTAMAPGLTPPKAPPAPEPPPAALQTITLPGPPRLCLTATPPATGPLVLFLHGIGGARGNWQGALHSVAPFAQAAAMDLRGYGGSALGPAQSTLADHLADILRVADAMGGQRLVLVGLSFGAWIATAFAQAHPDRLAGLVLAGGCTGMSEAGAPERAAFAAARAAPLEAGLTPADFAPDVVRMIAGTGATPAMRADMIASMAAIPATTYRDALTCFTNPPGRHDFARLTMPVLMMTGAQDRLAPPAEIRGVAARILASAPRPDVRFEQVAGAGHLCNIEAPQDFARILTDFVRRLAP